jgi:hypothetical protein
MEFIATEGQLSSFADEETEIEQLAQAHLVDKWKGWDGNQHNSLSSVCAFDDFPLYTQDKN